MAKRFMQSLAALILILTVAFLGLGLTPGSAEAAKGKFYVIGTGPAGPKTATLQALETIEKMDAIVAPARHAKLFAKYIGKTPVVADPWRNIWDYKGKPYSKLSKEELAAYKVERFKSRDRTVAMIKELMAKGKNVGLLDFGNPCLFGPSHWFVEHFKKDEIVIIPGMGCDSAAMAALGASTIPAHGTRFVVQTAPFFLMDRAASPGMGFNPDSPEAQQVLADLARHEHTLILYMALKDPIKLFKTLGRHWAKDMPAACVFWAGYPDKQQVVRGTVGDLGPKLASMPEHMMGLLFVGRFLEGKPYEAAMYRHQGGKK
ncbi:SAM-dependent methyltransferase [Dethiosulfatarculus sandiegensis]|uniref:Uroporphyrin-III C-methyltransferase n=1 Tax=Dethiosulfatarculus sandiegensis TaxID=1429043 RepID=A0A0D2JBJ0_9BACT|nr:SAM-dependent methyltransferase [Dethiosulfatarculus sandiegensis]KIX13116.1 uroporphyrin-III C-methyltransferase [Dethiosulfatarculus sandiegensis]